MSRQAEAKIADEDDGEEVEDAASEIAVTTVVVTKTIKKSLSDDDMFNRVVLVNNLCQTGFFVADNLIITLLPETPISEAVSVTCGTSETIFSHAAQDDMAKLLFLQSPSKFDNYGLEKFIKKHEYVTSDTGSNAFVYYYDSDNGGGASIPLRFNGILQQSTLNSCKRWKFAAITGNIPKETVGAPIIINNNGSISIIGIGIKLSGSTGELIVLPSAVFIETLSQLKKVEPIRNLIELAEAKNDDDLKYICARSAAAYEYAFKKQFEFADDIDSMISSMNQNRDRALSSWFNENSHCLRFIVTGTQICHRVGFTCVLPLSKEEYQKYKNREKQEYDLICKKYTEAETDEYDYFCFQSFVYESNIEVIYKTLKKAIIGHIMFLSKSKKGIYCIAEIGTRAGRLMSTVFDGGQDIGFSVDGRILKEWFFDGERLQKLKNEVKN